MLTVSALRILPSREECASVSVHLVDRAYGGPEEGGWWYDYGRPVEGLEHLTRFFAPEDHDAIHRHARLLSALCRADFNKGRPRRSSVLSQGEYEPHVSDGLPASWPEHRPHYE